jgi:hypothetical protein
MRKLSNRAKSLSIEDKNLLKRILANVLTPLVIVPSQTFTRQNFSVDFRHSCIALKYICQIFVTRVIFIVFLLHTFLIRDVHILDIRVRKNMTGVIRGVTKRCRLSWLTNSALVYEPKCGVSANECS